MSQSSRLPTHSNRGRSPTRTRATRSRVARSPTRRRDPLNLYKAMLTSLATDERIYINPLNDEGQLRTDDSDINNWFDISRNTFLRTRYYDVNVSPVDDESAPVVIISPVPEKLRFKIEVVIPGRGKKVAEIITIENLMGILTGMFNSGFGLYTDYDTISTI